MNVYIGVDPSVSCLAIAQILGDAASVMLWGQKQLTVSVISVRQGKHSSGDAGVVAMVNALAANIGKGFFEPLLQTANERFTAVEGQHYIPAGKAPAKDIARLGTVAGAAAGILAQHSDRLEMPTAMQWKGGRPKLIDQRRTARALGWEVEERAGYVCPANPVIRGKLDRITDWKEAMDAIGIALWMREQVAANARKKEFAG